MSVQFIMTMRIRHRLSVIKFFVMITVLFGCTGKPADQQSSKDDVKNIQHKIRMKELNGQAIDLNEYKGKTVFINFWATWCGPCVKEMPSIAKAKEILADRGMEFFLASNESTDQIENFLKKRDLDLHYVQLENLEELGIAALPTTYIINSAGELVFSETGYRQWNDPANIELLTKIIDSHE